MADNYWIKITMEAGKTGADQPYQCTTFVQNYDDHSQQVEEQTKCFNDVALVVSENMTATSAGYTNKKPKVKR